MAITFTDPATGKSYTIPEKRNKRMVKVKTGKNKVKK